MHSRCLYSATFVSFDVTRNKVNPLWSNLQDRMLRGIQRRKPWWLDLCAAWVRVCGVWRNWPYRRTDRATASSCMQGSAARMEAVDDGATAVFLVPICGKTGLNATLSIGCLLVIKGLVFGIRRQKRGVVLNSRRICKHEKNVYCFFLTRGGSGGGHRTLYTLWCRMHQAMRFVQPNSVLFEHFNPISSSV